MKTLKIKKVYPDAQIPTKGTADSAGYDLYAYIKAPVILKSGETKLISTGIAIALEDTNSVALVYARSSLGIKKGVTLANSVGVIDSDYRGELHVGLHNHSQEDYAVHLGDRIAQMVITPIFTPELEVVKELPETIRNSGGLGSTGR